MTFTPVVESPNVSSIVLLTRAAVTGERNQAKRNKKREPVPLCSLTIATEEVEVD